MAAAAGAGAGHDAREVVGAVADERRALLAQRGEYQLAFLAVGQHLAGFGIDDLDVDEVVPDVHAVVGVAGNADARAVHLGEAVNVVNLDAQLVLNAVAHLLAPALGADDALLQVNLVAQVALGDLLGEKQRVGAGGADDRGLQILHHLQLLLGVARPHGNGHGAQALGAQLETDAGRPQAVARGDLDAVERGDARHLVAAGELRGPVDDVLLGVGDDNRRARGARGAVDAHDFLVGHRLQPQRIHRAQVIFLGKGQLFEVGLGAHVRDIDTFELLRVERRPLLNGGQLIGDKLKLLFRHFHGRVSLLRTHLLRVCPILTNWQQLALVNHDNRAGKRRGDGWKDDFIAHLIDGGPSARGERACRLQLAPANLALVFGRFFRVVRLRGIST